MLSIGYEGLGDDSILIAQELSPYDYERIISGDGHGRPRLSTWRITTCRDFELVSNCRTIPEKSPPRDTFDSPYVPVALLPSDNKRPIACCRHRRESLMPLRPRVDQEAVCERPQISREKSRPYVEISHDEVVADIFVRRLDENDD